MGKTTIKPIKKIASFDNWDTKHEYGFATKSDESSIQELDLTNPVYQENGDTYYTIGDYSNNGDTGITDGNYASTLSQVSRDTGLSIEEILKLNPKIKNPDMLEIGQKIRVTNNSKESNTKETTTNSSTSIKEDYEEYKNTNIGSNNNNLFQNQIDRINNSYNLDGKTKEILSFKNDKEYNEYIELIKYKTNKEIDVYKKVLDEIDKEINYIDNCNLSNEDINDIILSVLSEKEKIEYINAYYYSPKSAIERYKLKPEVMEKIYEKSNYGPKNIEEYNKLKEQKQLLEAAIYKLEQAKKTSYYDNLMSLEEYQNYKSAIPTKEQLKDILKLIGPEYTEDLSKIEISYKEYCKKYGNISPAEFYKTCKEIYPDCNVTDASNKMDLSLLVEASKGNPDFLKTYDYIYEKEGLESANKYLEDNKDALNQMAGKLRAEEFLSSLEKDENGNYKQASLNQIVVLLKGFTDGVGNFGKGFSTWTEANDAYTVDDYETMYLVQSLHNNETLFKTLEHNYNISQSIGNMAPSMALSAITANPTIGLAALGGSAGGHDFHSALTDGYSIEQAVTYGILSGASEAVTEKFLGSIPGLGDVEVKSVGSWLKAAGQEGVEEFTQTWMDSITRSVLFSEEQNYSDVLKESLVSAGYGAATGGILNIPGLASSINSSKTQNINTETEEEVEIIKPEIKPNPIEELSKQRDSIQSKIEELLTNPDKYNHKYGTNIDNSGPKKAIKYGGKTYYGISSLSSNNSVRNELNKLQSQLRSINRQIETINVNQDTSSSKEAVQKMDTTKLNEDLDTMIESFRERLQNMSATDNSTIAQENSYIEAIRFFNELKNQDIKLTQHQEELLQQLYNLVTQEQNNNTTPKVDTSLDIDSILEEIYADVEEGNKKNENQQSIDTSKLTEELDTMIESFRERLQSTKSNIEATTNLTQDQYYLDAINLFNKIQQQDIKLSKSQKQSLSKLYDLIKQVHSNNDISVKIDTYLAIDGILEEIYADVEESKRNQILKEQEALLRDLLESDSVYDFIKRNNIDIQAMLKEYTTKNPRGIDFGNKRTMWKNSTVSIANILGASGESLLQTLNNCYNGTNTNYQTRSIGLLEASSDEILEEIKTGKDPIRITQTKDGNYVVAENGNHRISVLRMLYLNEINNATSQAEIDRINEKYNIPVQVLSEDTIVEKVDSILKDTKYEQVRRDIDGNIVLYGPEKINGNGVKYRDSIKISEYEANKLCKNPNMIFTTKIEVTTIFGYLTEISFFREDTNTIDKITKMSRKQQEIREYLLKRYEEELKYNPRLGGFPYFIEYHQNNNTNLTNIINEFNNLKQQITDITNQKNHILTSEKASIIKDELVDRLYLRNIDGHELLKRIVENDYYYVSKVLGKNLYGNIDIISQLEVFTPYEIALYLKSVRVEVNSSKISTENYNNLLKTLRNNIYSESSSETLKNKFYQQILSKYDSFLRSAGTNIYGVDQNATSKYIETKCKNLNWLTDENDFISYLINIRGYKKDKAQQLLKYIKSSANKSIIPFMKSQNQEFIFNDTRDASIVIEYIYDKCARENRFDVIDIIDNSFECKWNDEINRLGNKLISQGMSNAEALRTLCAIDSTGCCSYASVANSIMFAYKNNPQAFERDFGYPMYVNINGKQELNSSELLLDMYIYINSNKYQDNYWSGNMFTYDLLGNLYLNNLVTNNQVYLSSSNGQNLPAINSFLQSKNPNLHFMLDTSLNMYDGSTRETVIDMKEKLINYLANSEFNSALFGVYAPNDKGSIIKKSKHFRFLTEDLKTYVTTATWAEGGGHAIFVTGVTNDHIIVSSWGKKLYIPIADFINNRFNMNLIRLEGIR